MTLKIQIHAFTMSISIFHARPMLQNYLKIIPESAWIPIIKFKTSNHRLPIEIYSWSITIKKGRKGSAQCAIPGKWAMSIIIS